MRSSIVSRAVVLSSLVFAVTTTAAAPARRIPVRGLIISKLLEGPACTSPVGVCTAGRLTGGIQGTFVFTAKTLTPTADTPATGVMLYTGEIVIRTARGEIRVKDAGAINYTAGGTGDVGASSTIVGGTGHNTGISGRLRIAGTFTPDAGGRSEYHGYIVLP
jgi:hypothetical protein